jgi:beta-mannanase
MKRQASSRSRLTFVGRAIALVVIIAAIFKGPAYIRSTFYDDFYERGYEPVVGYFDHDHPDAALPVNIRHYAIVWKNTSVAFHHQGQLATLLKKGPALLSVETWLWNYWGKQSYNSVLDAVLQGEFNRNMDELARLITAAPYPVYVRWDPDMEVPVYQYPWQYHSQDLYIQAFNYVAARLKKIAPNVKIVWGPSGFPGDTEFWPGPGLADMVSITLGSPSEKESKAYPYQPALPQMLFLKLHRMRFVNKPVIVLGGDATQKVTFNKDWLKQQYQLEQQYGSTIYSPQNYVVTPTAYKPSRQHLQVGVFDPNRRLLNNPRVSVEHIFTDWGEIQRGDFKLKFDSIINRHHDAVVTVEPWRDTSKKADTNVLQSTLDGRYDKIIQKLYHLISNCGQTVYLRFAHEMEIPIHRYAWQSQNPVTYINAFRYFMLADKIHAKNIKRVWGPAGDRGSADWWPGSDVVDYISIAIYGLPDKNITDPRQQEAFSTIFKRKYYRMRFLNRPLFITEFGVKGSEDYQHGWLAGAAQTLKSNRHVFGICYFNLYDNPKAWGHINAPDWSISPRNMQFFCSSVGN